MALPATVAGEELALVEFRILGPLEVLVDGRRRRVGAAKQRTLLTVLLLDANRVVSRDRLIDALWGARSPATATTALRVYVSRLRKSLTDGEDGREQILTSEGTGYVLRVAPDQFDLLKFEELLGEADAALARNDAGSASASLAVALALWRGHALEDFTYEAFAQPAIARLEELRLMARERRIEAELALGRHEEVIVELEALVAEHPLREQLRQQLMVALYRSGRQADALATYKSARETLADELGIDPSPALREFERAVLRQDPTLAFTAEDEPSRPGEAGRKLPGDDYPERALLVVPSSDETLDALLALAEPLASSRPRRELLVARLLAGSEALSEASRGLHVHRDAMLARGVPTRAVVFTSDDPGSDLVRLASEQDVDLLLLEVAHNALDPHAFDAQLATVLAAAPCDVALLVGAAQRSPPSSGAVMVPMGGYEQEWAAVELGAWIAGALGRPLVLLGTTADSDAQKRDASRLLVNTSLALQRAFEITATAELVPAGAQAIIDASEEASLLVVGLPDRWRHDGLGTARVAVATRAHVPTLLVCHGPRPGVLAPRESHTRFTWALSGELG